MKTKEKAAKKEEFYPLFPEWAEVREWAKKSFTQERILDVGLAGGTAIILGVLLYSLYAAMHNYTITGF